MRESSAVKSARYRRTAKGQAATVAYRQRPEVRTRHRAEQKTHYRKYGKDYFRKYTLKDVGWTQERFDAVLQQQDGKCAICRSTFTNTPYADHEHATMTPRGLLCRACNFVIGHAHESVEVLRAAINYLEVYR